MKKTVAEILSLAKKLDDELKKSKKVVVNCVLGKHRSSVIVIVFLVRHRGKTWKQATAIVKKAAKTANWTLSEDLIDGSVANLKLVVGENVAANRNGESSSLSARSGRSSASDTDNGINDLATGGNAANKSPSPPPAKPAGMGPKQGADSIAGRLRSQGAIGAAADGWKPATDWLPSDPRWHVTHR